jgi:hypothetical protein
VDIYGFKKTMVALSKQGKIFGMSSFDGSMLWTSGTFSGDFSKIFIRKSIKREEEYISSQIVAVTSDSLTFLNTEGGMLFKQKLDAKAD